jgi:hypothetical protein
MAQVDSENSTASNVIPMRRRFLSTAAGGAALTLASPSARAAGDPVFAPIEAHRRARAAHLAAITEQGRLEEIGDRSADDIAEAACHADSDTLDELIETVPLTFAGLQAWAAYLDEIGNTESWMLEGYRAPEMVATLVVALENLAVTS